MQEKSRRSVSQGARFWTESTWIGEKCADNDDNQALYLLKFS